MPALRGVAAIAMLATPSCGPPAWIASDHERVEMALDSATPSLARHVVGTYLTAGCAPNCQAVLTFDITSVTGRSEGARLWFVPDDPSLERRDVWDAAPDARSTVSSGSA